MKFLTQPVRWILFLLAIMISGMIFSCGYSTPSSPVGEKQADLVIKSALIFTCDPQQPLAQAIAVRDGHIIYVGTDKAASGYIGTGTRTIQAGGKFIYPGFIDSHTHAAWLGMLSPMLASIYEAKSVDEIRTMVRNFASQNPSLPFIMAIGWKYDYIPNGIPTLQMAESILSDRPLILWSHDGHTGWVNKAALEKMRTANPDAFRRLTPVFDPATGEPNGIFLHFYSIDPFDYWALEEIGSEIKDRMAEGLKKLLNQALAVGVTTHHDVMIHKPVMPLLKEMSDKGCFQNARVKGDYFLDHYSLEDPERLVSDLNYWTQFGNSNSTSHLTLGLSVKLGMDGVSPTHTSFLNEPYNDAPGNYGIASWTQDDFTRIVKIIDGMKIQICTHATGDAAITRVINAYESARQANGGWDSRHTIEHCSLPVQNDWGRMAQLGIYAAMQPTHFLGTATTENALGETRMKRSHPWRSLKDAGVPIAFGTDYSIVPFNPILGLMMAALRINYKWETNWGPNEALSVADGINFYTIGSARAMKMEQEIGSLKVGKYGDMVMFSINLFDITSPEFLRAYQSDPGSLDHFVLLTLVEGRVVYQKPGESY